MRLYDEKKGYEDIKALSKDGRAVLSHIVRNAMCSILSAHCIGADVQAEIKDFENKWGDLGL